MASKADDASNWYVLDEEKILDTFTQIADTLADLSRRVELLEQQVHQTTRSHGSERGAMMADETTPIICYEYWEREIKHYGTDGNLIAIYENNKSVRPVLMDKDTKKVLATGAWYDITIDVEHERERAAATEGNELLEEYQRKNR